MKDTISGCWFSRYYRTAYTQTHTQIHSGNTCTRKTPLFRISATLPQMLRALSLLHLSHQHS